MKIINLSEKQFKNYSKMHSSRNYFQTVEYADVKNDYKRVYLGFINENDNTLMGAVLLLEKSIWKFKYGFVPGSFLIDYDNEALFKDFVITLKKYLKNNKYIYITTENRAIYKMFDKNEEIIYFDTNIIKLFDELSFRKINKKSNMNVVLETEKTSDETYKLFNLNTKRNITRAYHRAITIYKDENTNVDTLLNLSYKGNEQSIKDIVNYFKDDDNTSEIYFAKMNPEEYVNNYRFLLKKEEEYNDKLNYIMQDVTIKKSMSFINRKMKSDKLITKYNNEIIKATNIYSKYPEGVIVGAILIIKNNREIYFLNEGVNKELASIYSSHIIKWEIIKKYLNLGYKIFNFGSINNIDKKNGDYLFKIGFGGKIYQSIGDYDLIINKWLYGVTKLINYFRK